jgi:hypothetical protein
MRAAAEGCTPVERYSPDLQVVRRGDGHQRRQRAGCGCIQHDELSVRCGCGQQCAGPHTRVAPVHGRAQPGLTARLRACVCAPVAFRHTVPTTVEEDSWGRQGESVRAYGETRPCHHATRPLAKACVSGHAACASITPSAAAGQYLSLYGKRRVPYLGDALHAVRCAPVQRHFAGGARHGQHGGRRSSVEAAC